MITLVIPSHNNLRHMKNAYASVKKHAPEANLIILDDASTDGTYEYFSSIEDDKLTLFKAKNRVGHTVLYDVGIDMATTDIVGILHADMILGPNYVENMLKHARPGRVVCGTRVEPPLHPPGLEKVIENFGLDFDSLDLEGFEKWVVEHQPLHRGETTKGMFAPWVIYKEDFQAIGGHDWGFAPFPFEDSDIFQRWILAGYELVQSRDAFVYHLTCRGHKWTGQIGVADDYYKQAESSAREFYIKKWGSWIKNDQYQYPILTPVYKKCSVIKNYQPTNLDSWFGDINPENPNEYDVVVEFDLQKFPEEGSNVIVNLNQIVSQATEPGNYEVAGFNIKINSLEDRSKDLIFIDNSKYEITF